MGGEVYFTTPVASDEENPRLEVDVGEVAHWPAGKALAVFFGPTPASVDGRPGPVEAVNVLSLVRGDASRLREVRQGTRVEVSPAP